jgi:hypothetical protein
VDELKASGKPFQISEQEVWDAWVKVKGNKGIRVFIAGPAAMDTRIHTRFPCSIAESIGCGLPPRAGRQARSRQRLPVDTVG